MTVITAIDPSDGQLKEWAGPYIVALTKELAEQYCQANGLGYCRVIGQVLEEIPFSTANNATLLSNRDN